MIDEVIEIITKCSVPINMIITICSSCQRNEKQSSDDDEFEQYSPRKTLMNGWVCNGYLQREQNESDT